jgi:hypothetical protein
LLRASGAHDERVLLVSVRERFCLRAVSTVVCVD